ncbi:unnamed protein product [Knipowitschia caucasica]
MASASITRVGGVIVVTQVIPQSEQNAVLLEAPPPDVTQAPPSPREKMDKMAAEFHRGEPLIMGVFQLVLGLVFVLFSLTAAVHKTLLMHIPASSCVLFVFAGFVTLKAAKTTTPFHVRLAAGWSVLSSLLCVVGVAYVSWLLSWPRPSERLCEGLDYDKCFQTGLWMLDVLVPALLVCVMVLLLLQFSFSVTVSTFSIRAARQRPLESDLSESGESLLQPERDQ